jgi:hypothetical protein
MNVMQSEDEEQYSAKTEYSADEELNKEQSEDGEGIQCKVKTKD